MTSCTAKKDYGNRTGGDFFSKGVMQNVSVPRTHDEPTCTCIVESSVQSRWSPNAFCTDQPCSFIAAQRCDLRGGEYDFATCTCSGGCDPSTGGCSPILIDTYGNGFALTSASNGVNFDISGDGISEGIGWTQSASDDSFLALDKNGNGRIDNGKELFGNYTAPPFSTTPNGFLALAEYDKTINGGNEDQVIDEQDLIFNQLRLWRDSNHNGFSEFYELHSLSDFDIRQLDLRFQESRRTDIYGNKFKYKATVWDSLHARVERWAWDVFFTTHP